MDSGHAIYNMKRSRGRLQYIGYTPLWKGMDKSLCNYKLTFLFMYAFIYTNINAYTCICVCGQCKCIIAYRTYVHACIQHAHMYHICAHMCKIYVHTCTHCDTYMYRYVCVYMCVYGYMLSCTTVKRMPALRSQMQKTKIV